MNEYFQFDKKLGIHIPIIENNWTNFSNELKEEILFQWEQIRGTIPDRISELEKIINAKQQQLENEGDFEKSCALNSEIAELASTINDLWLLFRKNEQSFDKPDL